MHHSPHIGILYSFISPLGFGVDQDRLEFCIGLSFYDSYD